VGGFAFCSAGLFKSFILGPSLVPFVSTGSTYGAHQNGWWVGIWDWVGLGWAGLGWVGRLSQRLLVLLVMLLYMCELCYGVGTGITEDGRERLEFMT
jgi:hypothetical protein